MLLSYLSCFGLFPYFREQLVERIRDAPCEVSFDECMNKISQNAQMYFVVRY